MTSLPVAQAENNLPSVSAIVCTYNRAPLLREALASLLAQECDALREIIVVDNNSADDTPEVVHSIACTSQTPLIYTVERRQGLSYARNHGIELAQGDLLAFLDDDALADPSWLQKLATAHVRHRADVVGGPVLLTWRCVRPAWWTAELDGFLSAMHYGDQAKQAVFPLFPYGGNLSIRRELLAEMGGFCAELGRSGRTLLEAEEMELLLRLEERGARIWYTPDAVVYHIVDADRATKSYLRRRCIGSGRSQARLDALVDRRRLVRHWLKTAARFASPVHWGYWLATFDFLRECWLRVDAGYVWEGARCLLQPRPTKTP